MIEKTTYLRNTVSKIPYLKKYEFSQIAYLRNNDSKDTLSRKK